MITKDLLHNLNSFYRGKHVVSPRDFDVLTYEEIFRMAEQMEDNLCSSDSRAALKYLLIKDKGANKGEPYHIRLIMDPSLRTCASFQDSIRLMGGTYDWTPREFSSMIKGETAWSTLRTVGARCDGIIIRHDKYDDAAKEMADAAEAYGLNVRVINAGCGSKWHPTQTLIDLYTARKYRRAKFEAGQLVYILIGDISHSRTIHSLIGGISHYGGHVICVGPEGWDIPSYVWEGINFRKLTYERCNDLKKVIAQGDIIYFTRLQKNLRGDELSKEAESQYAKEYGVAGDFLLDQNDLPENVGVNKDLLKLIKDDALVLHPLPHGKEFPKKIDLFDQRFVHHKQADFGILVRMALLKMLFAPNADIKQIAAKYEKDGKKM